MDCTIYSGNFGCDYSDRSECFHVTFDNHNNMIIKWIGSVPIQCEELEGKLQDLWFSNSELEMILPWEIGALTDGMLVADVDRDDQGEITSIMSIWWHDRYQIEDPVVALMSKEGLRLTWQPE